jgi:hypothetical protein
MRNAGFLGEPLHERKYQKIVDRIRITLPKKNNALNRFKALDQP